LIVLIFFSLLSQVQLYQQAVAFGDWYWGLVDAWSFDVKRAMAGRMVYSVLQAMDDMIQNPNAAPNPASPPPPIKFLHYSGHDTTVAPFLALIGAYDKKWPVFASHVGAFAFADFFLQ
jgi:hypothetical protein